MVLGIRGVVLGRGFQVGMGMGVGTMSGMLMLFREGNFIICPPFPLSAKSSTHSVSRPTPNY